MRWRHGAAPTLRLIPWREAARVDAAVLRFAATGEGDLESVGRSIRYFRLLLPGYGMLIELDAEAHRLDVWAITRQPRP